MAIEPLEEQWCLRKMQKILLTQEKDYTQYQRFKEHMAKLSQQSLIRVINTFLQKPQLEMMCEIASISNICRDYIIRGLPNDLPQKTKQMYYTYLCKICIAFGDYHSYYTLLEKIMVKNGEVDINSIVKQYNLTKREGDVLDLLLYLHSHMKELPSYLNKVKILQ